MYQGICTSRIKKRVETLIECSYFLAFQLSLYCVHIISELVNISEISPQGDEVCSVFVDHPLCGGTRGY